MSSFSIAHGDELTLTGEFGWGSYTATERTLAAEFALSDNELTLDSGYVSGQLSIGEVWRIDDELVRPTSDENPVPVERLAAITPAAVHAVGSSVQRLLVPPELQMASEALAKRCATIRQAASYGPGVPSGIEEQPSPPSLDAGLMETLRYYRRELPI